MGSAMASEPSAIDVASTYLDALVSQDADRALLAPDVRRLHNGEVMMQGADAIRDILRREPLAGMGDRRWVVDGGWATIVKTLPSEAVRSGIVRASMKASPAARPPASSNASIPPGRASWRAATACCEEPTGRPVHCEGDDERGAVVRVAQSYLESLLSHDASGVALAENAYRIENGTYMGSTGAEIRAALEHSNMNFLDRIEDVRWYAAPGSAVAFYTLYVNAGAAGEAVCKIGERFRVYDGALVEIEVVYSTEMAT
jgi:hypothetical protein